ncbi:uncharacterized protein LOC128679359 [Plodia interpunctella]|uniref:uncharacterized protein LOC128679359 n=1 Tax=Plodia interpunctella TaxID=58824 RepID=UPI0023682FC3|nr:uncharacterized protein LOC128679359 [Plodia interpunctella]
MAPIFWFLALLIQGSFIYADKDIDDHENENTSREILSKTPEEGTLKNLKDVNKDWLDMFLMPGSGFSPAASKMAQVAQSDKSIEEQLEEIKQLATQITFEIQSEMANLLSYALAGVEQHEKEDNILRKKRSTESPMDSTQMVMRLLKHIKSNNEYQNIAIEKMMTAQEIADKYGIEFNPDPEILTDLAIAANEQAQEMTSILNDALQLSNKTNQVEFVPLNETLVTNNSTENDHDNYYMYSVHVPAEQYVAHQNAVPHHDYYPDMIQGNHYHQDFLFYPESQIVSPPVHQHYNQVPQSSPMPNFHEPMTFFPSQDFYPQYHTMEPVTTTTTIVLPFENHFEPEPELVKEEFEETVTSKVFVDHEEPGASTVNHVMTYTISEKSHFKQPQVEKLPQQMQYYFFLV